MSAEEKVRIRRFEDDFRAIVTNDLFDLCSKCSDKAKFAEAYRKAKKELVYLANEWPGEAASSPRANHLNREIMVRDTNIMLNGMAIWFNGMLGARSLLASQKVPEPNRVLVLHKEIEEYVGDRTT